MGAGRATLGVKVRRGNLSTVESTVRTHYLISELNKNLCPADDLADNDYTTCNLLGKLRAIYQCHWITKALATRLRANAVLLKLFCIRKTPPITGEFLVNGFSPAKMLFLAQICQLSVEL